MYEALCCRDRNTQMQKPQPSLIQEQLEERPTALSLPYLPPPACMVTLQDAGQTIHVYLSPSSACSHLLRHSGICIFWRAASDHAQSCTCRFTVCPDGRSNLESNLRPPFQRLQIPMSRLRQKLLQLLVFELAGQKCCKYTPSFLTFYCRWLFRHIHIGLASVRGGSYRSLPLMTIPIENGWL